MKIEPRVVDTSTGKRAVLVVTPVEHIVVGRDRLQALRERVAASQVDEELLAVARANPDLHGFVMLGTSPDGRGTWRFDDALDDAQRRELAILMIRAHMPFKRLMFLAGCHDSLYVDWREADVQTMTRAASRLRAELHAEAADTPVDTIEGKRVRLDRWIVERLTFYQGVSLESVLHQVLPKRIERRDQRRPLVEELLGHYPKEELAGCG
ncbi:MAG: hypothetical protein AAF799_38050 [Myxococcota bacterium]